MASPENRNPKQSSFEQYDPEQSSGVADGDYVLSPSGANAPSYEQPAQQFPSLASKNRLHDDAPHTAQLVNEAAAGIPDRGLPAYTNAAMLAHATLPPEAISDAITHDILDHIGKNGWDAAPHEISELEAARLEMQKKHYLKKIIPAIGSGALMWAALKFGMPADTLSDSTRNNIAWVMGAGTTYLGYVFSGLVPADSPRRYRKAAQKEMKNLQKQEQQRRAITENHSS